MAAPLLGLLAAAVVAVLNLLYMKYCLNKVKEKGEVYVPPTGAGIIAESTEVEDMPNVWLSLLPMVVVLVFFKCSCNKTGYYLFTGRWCPCLRDFILESVF